VATSNVGRDSHRGDCLQSSTLEDRVRAVVQEAVRSPLHLEDAYFVVGDTHAIRKSLRALCAHAHGDGTRVERLIISLKHAVETVPAAQSIARARGGEHVVSQLVALVIDEFYRTAERDD